MNSLYFAHRMYSLCSGQTRPHNHNTRVSAAWHTEYLYKWLRWTLACSRVKGNRTSNSQIPAAEGNIKVTDMQRETLGDTDYLCSQYICRIGTVHRITDRGDVRVQYSNNIRWTFHPGALTKVRRSFWEQEDLSQLIISVFNIFLSTRWTLLELEN